MKAGVTSERDYLARRFGDLPAWAKDRITTAVEVRLDFKERVLVLIGRPLMVDVNIECAVPPGRIESFSWAWAARWRWPWSPKGGAVESAPRIEITDHDIVNEVRDRMREKCLACPHPGHGLSGCVDGCGCTYPAAQADGRREEMMRQRSTGAGLYHGNTGWGVGE